MTKSLFSKSINKRKKKSSVLPPISILTAFLDNLMEGNYRIISIKCKKEILELENYHFGIPDEIIDLENDHQWLLKPLGKMLTGNFFNG